VVIAMNRKHTRIFSHKGRQLEIRAVPFADEWKVRVFENGKQVTPVAYSVAHEARIDANWQLKTDLIEALMRLAQDDIERGTVPLMPQIRTPIP